jgi:signal transduction histidine kinase
MKGLLFRLVVYGWFPFVLFLCDAPNTIAQTSGKRLALTSNDSQVSQLHQRVDWLSRRSLYDSASKVLDLCDSILANTKEEALKHKQLIVRATMLFNRSQVSVAIDTLTYVLARPIHDSLRIMATILRCDYIIRSRYDKSAPLDLLSIKDNEWLLQSDYWQVRWHATNASILDYMEQFEPAAQAYLQSLEFAKKLGDPHVEARVLSGLGSLFISVNQDSMALHYAGLSEAIYAKTEENEGLSKLYNITAIALKNMGRLNEARYYYQKDIDFNSKSGKLSSLVITYHNLGILFIMLDMLDSGQYCLDRSVALCKQIGMPIGFMYNYYGYGNLAFKRSNWASAVSYYKQSYDHAESISNLTFQYTCSDSLASCYARMGNYQQAFIWINLAKQYLDSLHKVKQASEIEKLKIQFEEKELKLENDVLRLVNTQSESKITAQRWVIGMVILLLLGSVFFAFLLQSTLRKRRKLIQKLLSTQEEVTRQNKDLERLNKEVLDQKKVLEERQKALLLSNSLKDTILSVISHDFRSPLTSLSQLVSMLAQKQMDQPTFESLVPTLDRDIKQNLMLIDNLLLWSRSFISDEKLQPSIVSPKSIFRETVGLYERQIADKELFVNIDLPETAEVGVSPEVVSLVARNLLSNAVKFSRKNGAISIYGTSQNDSFKVSVTDTGIGMSEEMMQNLFTKIGKPSRGTSNEKGFGIGLKFLQDILSKNRCIIEVESKVGKGSTFSVSFPSKLQ